ncbi:MAG: T9SS type A sorting domain-containing protein [Owenweeksia sp.]|nr:T9SS type A sorting domain-containing protein [Owenweeksia sp.]
MPDDFTPLAEVHFYDMSGRSIKELQLEGYQNSLALKGLPKGVLIATIRSNGLEVSRKVLVY